MIADYLKTLPLYLLPQHFLSALVHRLMRLHNKWLKNHLIRWFVRRFDVNLDESEIDDISKFECFNDFFTRALKQGARQLERKDNYLLCPVDGTVSELGVIHDQQLLQAKGQHYDLLALLAGNTTLMRYFSEGSFITLYLSPKDYHRIHMPVDGQLQQMIHVPGDLFSVNQASVRTIPRLFARNERVINIFDTTAGRMALIQVGAIFVSSIETIWHGEVTPPRRRQIQTWNYPPQETLELRQTQEMGRFNMGSTVILLFEKNRIEFAPDVLASQPVFLGQTLGKIHESQ